MTYLGFIIYRSLTWCIANMPFRLMYVMSDLLSFLLHHIIRYRRATVYEQLTKCFPDKTTAEIKAIARDSYTNLSDIILESFKTGHTPVDEISRRYRVINPEVINELTARHKHIIATASHLNNWEWGTTAMNHLLQTTIYGLYKPVGNPYLDAYIQKSRGHTGTRMVSIKETRSLFDPLPVDPAMIVFIADQSPSNMREAIWLTFLNRDTACLHGPEKYVRQSGLPAIYMHVYRVKRGFYEVLISPLNISDEGPGITQQFMSLLEKDIRQFPSSWLWTHKRWKRRREEAEEQAKKISQKKPS